MKISVPLLALIAFVFYFGWKAYKNREQITEQLTGVALDAAKSQVESQLQVTKDWFSDLTRYWKSVWK